MWLNIYNCLKSQVLVCMRRVTSIAACFPLIWLHVRGCRVQQGIVGDEPDQSPSPSDPHPEGPAETEWNAGIVIIPPHPPSTGTLQLRLSTADSWLQDRILMERLSHSHTDACMHANTHTRAHTHTMIWRRRCSLKHTHIYYLSASHKHTFFSPIVFALCRENAVGESWWDQTPTTLKNTCHHPPLPAYICPLL